MEKVKAAGEGALLDSEERQESRGSSGSSGAPGRGREASESPPKGLSFPHSLTRSSREHLTSGKDRKTAGFMVTLGSAAGTGVGGWEWAGLGWARKGLGSGNRQQ